MAEGKIKKEEIIKEELLEKEIEEKEQKEEFFGEVVAISRVTRVTAGGKRFRFRILVVFGNKKGKVGVGVGKAPDIADAVAKATNKAKKNIIEVSIVNDTIPFKVEAKWRGAHVLLKPAGKGVGVIAGSILRTIFELAGIKNISGKIIASSNKINNAQATILALKRLKELKEHHYEFRKLKEKDQTKDEKKKSKGELRQGR